jgi:tetratricopeptide (TPR) repeat protein
MNNFLKNCSAKRWIGIVPIILVGMIAYHNCLPNEMFWDDDDFINNNRFIRDFHFWPLWFSQNLVAGSYLVSNYWRPLLLAIFTVEWHWWQNWVYGWHAVSVGVHILVAVTLYFLMNRLFAQDLLALCVALIFVCHPVHNEAVVYVNSMGDSLATFFVLSSLLLYACFRQSRKPAWASRSYWLSLLLLPLAILSKETGFVLVGLLPLTDFLLLSKAKTLWGRVKQTAAAVWPFICLGLIYIILRGTVLNFNNSFNFYNENNAFTTHISLRLMTFFKAMVQYTGFLFFPYQLRVERDFPWAHSVFQWDVIAGGLLVGSMLFSAFKYWRTRPLISFGIGWFFIAIAPASNVLVPINSVLYEHFLYMPMIGIVLIVSSLSLDWAQKHRLVPTMLKILVLIIAIFCAINIHRNLDWRTSIGFYEQLITYRPDDYRVINNLGMEYANKGFNDKAIVEYNKAIALDPRNPVAYHNIAGSYRDTGHAQLALDNFNKAIELNPNFIFTYRSLAALYWQLGEWEKCKENLLQILRMDPQDERTRQALQTVEAKLTP